MRRAAIILILLALLACGEDPNVSESSPTEALSPEATATAAPSATQSQPPDAVKKSQFLELPEVGRVEVTNSCQFEGPDGTVFRAELATGGALQLRKIDGTDVLLVSALPSPEADPVSTKAPSDTTYTEEDGYIIGTSQLWLDESDNKIDVRFRVFWDDSTPQCAP
jgi:hypothetical protein